MALRGLICILGLLLCGCVERWLEVRSEPAGARVFVDGEEIGRTPVRLAFEHYGTREVLVRADIDPAPTAYASVVQLVKLSPPWYEYFPLDLFAENLWPGTLVDSHTVTITLPVFDPSRRQQEVRDQLDALDVEAKEKSPGPSGGTAP